MSKFRDLDQLLEQSWKTPAVSKPPRVPKKPEVKINFDADRFRWYFKNRDGKTIEQWRKLIDEEMFKCEEQISLDL
jgi:hypothetical protein